MKRTMSLAVAVAAAGAALFVPAAPAGATTAPAVTIKLGQSLTIQRPPISGVSTVFQANTGGVAGVGVLVNQATPEDCAGEQFGCEVVPVSFPVPDEEDPDAIEAAGYVLEVELSWDSGQSVENLPEAGTLRQNRVEAYVFQNPPIRNANGDPNYTIASNGANPAAMAAVNPTSNKFNIVVANMHGVNNGYTLKLALSNASQLKFDPSEYVKDDPSGGDYVQPQPPSFEPSDSGFGGSVAPPLEQNPTPPTGGPVVADPIVVPNIPGGKPDAKLVALSKVTVRSGLGKTGAQDVSSTVTTAQVDTASGTTVLLALLALPVLAGVLALALLVRRRRAAQATA